MTLPRPSVALRALRPKQWVKNLLVAAAPIAAGVLDEADVAWRTLAGIALFTAASGATYLFNDAADVELDRTHPTKSMRPIAAGELDVDTARWLAAILGFGSVLAGTALAWGLGIVLAVYLLINVWYSLGMKHIPFVELGAIASGFVLRALAGGAATSTPLSVWFGVVVCAGSLFVVAGNRGAELLRTGGNGGRDVLQHYSLRGLRLLRAVCASVAVVGYALWVFAQDIANEWVALLSLLPFAAAFARYSADIEAGRGEDPEDFMLGDRVFAGLVLAWCVIYGLAVYG